MLFDYTEKELDLLARLMRAEAIGEGELGMLMVGNVGANRIISDCLTFKNIRSVEQMVYQNPGGFSGSRAPLFEGRATTRELELARRIVRGEYFYPATHALWFYAPKTGTSCTPTWYEQTLAGRYKNHCFYRPDASVCTQLY